mmetsp:Transcript_14605/g.20721  ORF Transcript_14605/g.20721 Transcript_14605/m.20721 type:complete len:419 (-) Transcript_14605:138-1394(-)|eukprot:CAMPEP_0175088804 /NCGR_PEP_ID=MMETSP0086_2-20121207/444_1 /TAXON_ID=136419 /ORGANISM="Unknown Unknown, Strain D1" /LENGTH=418 /DNA_ID=CAMNT_0016361263 /DNA_START=100 /DNA_END=1356 /DNA_ORIENTATION=+
MSDVKDMLGVSNDASSSSSSSAPAMPSLIAEDPQRRRKSKAPRELICLRDTTSWDDSTAIAPAPPTIFKAKRNKAVSWKCLPINSSSRADVSLSSKPDDIKLYHWVKIHNVPDYRFARFNKMIKTIHYTDEEYEEHLQEPFWTRAQTDRLFALCKSLDLRFLVIHDRFTNPMSVEQAELLEREEKELSGANESKRGDIILSKDKTIEDLKDRYYSIVRKLLQVRNSSDPDLHKHPVMQVTYDPEYETQRKDQMEMLLQRNAEAVHKQAELVQEERILRNQIAVLKKHERASRDGGRKRKRSTGELADLPESCIAKKLIKDKPPGAHLRSSYLTAPTNLPGRQSNKQFETELASLNIKKGVQPFPVPTGVVCQAFNKMRTDLVTLINLQRLVAKKETERDNLKAQLRSSRERKKASQYQ